MGSAKDRVRKRVETGIRRDQFGFEAYVYAAGQQIAQRFPLGTGLREMRAWRETVRHRQRWNQRVQPLTPKELKPPKAVPKHIDRHCFVYFIECGGRIKIGRTTDVTRRVREMSTFTHDPVNLLAAVPAHASLEPLIHDRFAAARVKGEWYDLTPPLENFIAYMQQNYNPLILLFDHETPL